MTLALAASLFLAASAAAEPKTAPAVELLTAAGYAPTFSTRFAVLFDRVLRDKAGEAKVLDVETVAVSHAGLEYGLGSSSFTGRVEALDNADAIFYLTPAQPELLNALRAASAADPAMPPNYAAHAVVGADKVVVESSEELPRAPRATLAVRYRLAVRGAPVAAVFLLRTHGGLGRLATVLDGLRRGDRPQLVVSHGNWVRSHFRSAPRGRALYDALEKAGLQVSAVGLAELKRWPELAAYRRDRPGGIRFVSANVDAKADPVPPEAVFELGGRTVAVLGLTAPSAALQLGASSYITVSDPVEAARRRVAELRPRADLIVLLSNLSEGDNARVRAQVRGIDAIVTSADELSREDDSGRGRTVFEDYRAPFSAALLTDRENDGVGRLQFFLGDKDAGGLRRLEIRQTERPLDETAADKPGFPVLDAADFEAGPGAGPALIPSARRIFGGERSLEPRDFWTLAATALARREGAEVGILPVSDLGAPTPGDFREGEVRNWFPWDDSVAVFDLEGDDLLDLVREAGKERWQPTPGRPPLAIAGVGPKETVHGAKIERSLTYRVAGSELLLRQADAYPALGRARRPAPRGDLAEGTVDGLKTLAARKLPPEKYASLMEGDPLEDTALWIVNFRDVSLDYTNTKVVRDDAFGAVPNSRINSFDSRAIGATARGNVDYRYRTHKWTNSADVRYAEQESFPPGAPHVVDLISNRAAFQSNLTERLGAWGPQWLSNSVGPSLGVQYEGEVKRRRPGARRRSLVSVLPGVELYDGDVVQSLQVAGNLQRDYSVDPAKSHYGLSARMNMRSSLTLPAGIRAKVIGEFWYDYFFRRPGDSAGDLLSEGDASLRLSIPIWKDFALAPFVDFYFFTLKERPLNGYSAMTGVSFSFSRLWKPQYERL